MSTTASDEDQCKAITGDGDRCSRPATDDGFCHQHDSSDETIDDAEDAENADEGDDGDADRDGDDTDETGDGAGEAEGDDGSDGSTDETDDQDTHMSSGDSQSAETEIGEVRQTVQETAEGVVGHPLDGITSIDDTDSGWRVAVEVVERKSVPDTQDILGRYEITLDDDLSVTGYQRTHRYRRDDMNHDI